MHYLNRLTADAREVAGHTRRMRCSAGIVTDYLIPFAASFQDGLLVAAQALIIFLIDTLLLSVYPKMRSQ